MNSRELWNKNHSKNGFNSKNYAAIKEKVVIIIDYILSIKIAKTFQSHKPVKKLVLLEQSLH